MFFTLQISSRCCETLQQMLADESITNTSALNKATDLMHIIFEQKQVPDLLREKLIAEIEDIITRQ